ncbi:glutaredoxin [Vibrio parahaemolyticus]|nr:glutaredoxin [Vibrio parahaemolyticus]
MKAVVYSKDACPFCVKAINLLNEKNVDIEIIKIGVDISKEDMVARIQEQAGVEVQTVPQIILDEVYIGGFTDLDAYFDKEDALSIDLSDMTL